MTILSVLWFFLIFLLIAGYFVLDGFDLGAGVLYPFLCKTDEDKHIVRRALGPVWDGNEVWLLTAGGALFAAFPDAYATTFSGFYLAIMLVLFGLIVRAVSFEFWAADSRWRGVWDVCFFLGSLIPALLFGVAVGCIIQGIPMDAQGNYTGIPLLGLISPFTLLTGILGLVMFIAAGACWIALKAPLDSGLRTKAMNVRPIMQVLAIVLFCIATLAIFNIEGMLSDMSPDLNMLRILCAALFLVALVVAIIFEKVDAAKKLPVSDLVSFLCQSISAVALVFLLAFSMFPVLVNASADSVGAAITLMSAGATELSLTYMTVILCIGLPFVLVYHVIIYRTFRGRIQIDEAE